jgi:TonB family protein
MIIVNVCPILEALSHPNACSNASFTSEKSPCSSTMTTGRSSRGKARDIHVARSLGGGLEEKAIEAVEKWRFKPGMKGGQTANVRATIEVNFRLL